MENSNFIVRIPEPCHEDWNKMQPDAKGKFCNSCSKSVFDFSTKTDTEIKDILMEYKDQKMCDHFKKSQVNRPLNISINLRDLPKNISITKAFGIALFLVFGTFLFSCTDKHGQKVNTIEVIDSKPEEKITMGDISFIPPAQLAKLTGEPLMPTDSIETISYNESYTTTGGAVSVEIMPYEEIIPELVTVEKDTVIYEPMMVGMMVMDYVEPIQDTATDNARKAIIEDVISRSTSFGIYPNPGNGEFTIKYDVIKRSDVRLDVFDMKGVLLRTIVDITNQHEGKYQIPVNLSELPNGIYLITLINNGKKSVERLVIER